MQIEVDIEKVKEELSSILYAEHMGDVQRSMHRLAPLLGLPTPIWNDAEDVYEHPEIWPWDAYIWNTNE